jgi:hypothetical protein
LNIADERKVESDQGGRQPRSAGRRGRARRESKSQKRTLSHVVSLKHLTLVGSSISVHGKSGVVAILSEVLLSEGDSCAEGDLSSDDSVAAEEAVEWGVRLVSR